ncbi:uncharacterized protein LOC126094559 isoform X1 [Schistocerca cancellata]|uniref:uncharacterized protein LOC126094559 isoform X1 n=1 Tax=Schistocerca cancellata TaxID=274614 RepID=UPI0021184E9F|nr:uncharacterized protein LOC126094559 isoform X1 [Schistocerca cancellata]XP_049764963.1 uncharacterized protein LOC126094559 isoform X1 [Schistocerca cancellata]XP_049764964.1 uncharacterized protein LOC126094559 isoform X1 [Schistocerca cancellata]XP_049764965.1 uncharacterized protein LOC126094559 isoform X1 [Schistocerca cancellata]XP_049764966.1 uncharacterized protein LOC126094559 isoform X1 [Schistocerca cancellata]
MEEENMETTHINFKTKLYKVLENSSTPYQNITVITVGNRTPIECIWIVISASTASLFRDKYSEYCKEKQVPAVSESKFREIFVSEFNIGFKLPKSDACSKCDGFLIAINNSELCAEVTEKKQQYELHLKKADRGQNMIVSLTALAKENSKEHHMIAVDMQQTFPTPKLTVAPAFYKRKIRTYNYGIHDCGSNKAYMFLWSEKDGGRGSDEVGSCLLKYLEITNPQTKHLHIITDNCEGQGKNWTIIALGRSLVATKRFDSVQHYFPVVGHTMLPCDHDFGSIERYARNRRPIVHTPDQWAEVIKSASPKHFIVTKMEREDFRSLESLKALISKRTESTTGDPHHFSEATQFKFESEDPFKLSVKHSYSDIGAFMSVDIRVKKKGRIVEPNPYQLPIKYRKPLPINQKNIDDVLSLMPYIPAANQDFFRSCTGNNVYNDEVEEVP